MEIKSHSEDWGVCSEFCGTQSKRPKAARISHGSRMSTTIHEDPLPEYIDPHLLKLIAQNAPLELDVFERSLRNKAELRPAETKAYRGLVTDEGGRSPMPVESLLCSVIERNKHLAATKGCKEFRHSCPDRIRSDYDGEDELGGSNVKRKRPQSMDTDRIAAIVANSSSLSLSSASIHGTNDQNDCSSQIQRANTPYRRVASHYLKTRDHESRLVEDVTLATPESLTRVSSTPPDQLTARSDSQLRDSKPWRHGMRKSLQPAEDNPPQSGQCKRKAEADSQRNVEVRKYMETKLSGRRKEQKMLKAAAAAALAARKEQQQKLDSHRQALLQLQLKATKHREHLARPAWVSECTNFGEIPRPWSSSSSSDLNIHLPPPVTPPKVEPVPLDLYTTRFQYAEQESLSPGASGHDESIAISANKRRSKKIKGFRRERQRQINRKSEAVKVFPHRCENCDPANPPIIRKARWKSRLKPVARKLSSEEVSQLQLAEHKLATYPVGTFDEFLPSRTSTGSNKFLKCEGCKKIGI